MESKTFKGQFKSLEETGIATVIFATLQTIDHDNDWIEKGAVKEQSVKICGSHNWKAAPIGIAQISEDGNEAVAKMKFNLEMPSAKEWYESIRFNHENKVNQEYSFGFTVLDSEPSTRNGKKVRVIKELDIFEVSPVLMGAGINTRTLDIKGYSGLRGTWESMQEAIRFAATSLLLGNREGWVSIEGTYDASVVVCSYSYDGDFPTRHYEFDWSVNDDGTVALSNQREVDLQVIVAEKNLKLSDLYARLLGEVSLYAYRSKAAAAARVKVGRTLSRANRERLARLVSDLSALLTETDTESAPEEETQDEGKSINADALFAEHLKLQSQLAEVLA